MKNVILLLAFCLLATLTFSQGKVENGNIVIGKIDSVQSNILGGNRKIWVYVPDGAVNNTERFPVVYVLDGDGHFSSVVGVTQQLSTINGNTMCPKMIIVGIPNTDRTRDLTPTHITSYEKNYILSNGKGEKSNVTDGGTINLGINYGLKIGNKGFLNLTGEYVTRGETNRTGTYTGQIFPSVGGVVVDNDELAKRGLTRDDFDMRIGNSNVNGG